jgi:hypothetical protein
VKKVILFIHSYPKPSTEMFNMLEKYRICLSSPPDRENLVAEIFFEGCQWAEIHQEHSVFEIEFYPRPDGRPWKVGFSSAINALNEAKSMLTSTRN